MDLTVTDPMRCCQCTCGDIGNSVDGALFQSADSWSVGTSPWINLTLTATSSANTGATKRREKTSATVNREYLCEIIILHSYDYSHVLGLCPEPAYSAMMIFQIMSSDNSTSHRGMADFQGCPSTGKPTPPFLMRQNR